MSEELSNKIDIDHLRTWIGKQACDSDSITPELLKRFLATLNGYTTLHDSTTASLPLGVHWCLAQPTVAHSELGDDGHPAKGGFLPPVPLPRRMWASSRISFIRSPSIGVPIEKNSTIADVVLKKSTSAGPLVFVHIDHVYSSNSVKLIEERQTIVYRGAAVEAASNEQPASTGRAEPLDATNATRMMTAQPDSTLLFRYSALTFNAHRIHYDYNYATIEEAYPGLVVQGPLMATLLMNFAQNSQPNSSLREFEFKGVAPAFADEALQLAFDTNAKPGNADSLEIRNPEGALVMTANAQFSQE